MNTYNFTFNTGETKAITAKNVTFAQAEAVKHMTENDITESEMIAQNGTLLIIRKDGSYHWNHDGFSFSSVPAEQIATYRNIVRL